MRVTLLFLVSVFIATAAAAIRDDALWDTVNRIEASVEGLRSIEPRVATKGSELREAVLSREFPVQSFVVGTSRLAKDTEQAAEQAARGAGRLAARWASTKEDGANLAEAIENGRTVYATIELKELVDEINAASLASARLVSSHKDLTVALTDGYKPRTQAEAILNQLGWLFDALCFFSAAILPLVYAIRSRKNIILLWLAVMLLIGALYVGHVLAHHAREVYGPAQSITSAWRLATETGALARELSLVTHSLNETLSDLHEQCEALLDFNETVASKLSGFSKHLGEIATKGGSNALDEALKAIDGKREDMRKHRTALEHYYGTGSSKTRIDNIVKLFEALEALSAHTELVVFTNLKIGYDMNMYLEDNLGMLLEYAEQGKLSQAIEALETMRDHQAAQLDRLNVTNSFVRRTNDAVGNLRRESASVKPDLSSEEWYFIFSSVS